MIHYRDLCKNVENHWKYGKVCPNSLSPKTFHHVLWQGAHLKIITTNNAYLNLIICPVNILRGKPQCWLCSGHYWTISSLIAMNIILTLLAMYTGKKTNPKSCKSIIAYQKEHMDVLVSTNNKCHVHDCIKFGEW